MMTESLDELDLRILEQLQQDASLTNQDLAERVHASAPTCMRRVRRLTVSGVIQKQVALVDPAKVGTTLTAILEVTLDIQSAENLQQFEGVIALEAAVPCARASGPDSAGKRSQCSNFFFNPPQQVQHRHRARQITRLALHPLLSQCRAVNLNITFDHTVCGIVGTHRSVGDLSPCLRLFGLRQC